MNKRIRRPRRASSQTNLKDGTEVEDRPKKRKYRRSANRRKRKRWDLDDDDDDDDEESEDDEEDEELEEGEEEGEEGGEKRRGGDGEEGEEGSSDDEDDDEEEFSSWTSSSEDEETKAEAKRRAQQRQLNASLLPPGQALAIRFTDKCDISGLELCALCGSLGKEQEAERLLWCKDCAECFHEFCFPHPLQLKSEALKKEWQCHACKTCKLCGGKEEGRVRGPGGTFVRAESREDESKRFALCARCDKGFHLACLSSPLATVPELGTWVFIRLRFPPFCSSK